MVENILTDISNTSKPPTEFGDQLEAPSTGDSPIATVCPNILSVNDMELEEGTSQLKMQIKYPQASNKELKAKLHIAEKKLSFKGKALVSLKKEIQQLRKEKAKSKVLHTRVREALSTAFTESQIKFLVQKQKKIHWDNDSISIAFTLRYLSNRAYVFLRNKLHYPLPGLLPVVYPPSQPLSETEDDGLHYVAGWLAKKFKSSHPEIGDFTYKLKCNSYILPSWVSQLSYGGLVEPSGLWKNAVFKMDNIFLEFNGNSIRKGPVITKNLTETVMSFLPETDKVLIHGFSRLRTFIRIRYLNVQQTEQALLASKKRRIESRKRKEELSDLERKKNPKMPTIVQ